jgi:hypothetical protein
MFEVLDDTTGGAEQVPVTDAEIDMFEVWFGDILDGLPGSNSGTVTRALDYYDPCAQSSIGVVCLRSRSAPVSVVETPEFLSATRQIMDEEERSSLVDYLAHNPLAGDLIQGTGGVRKLRWALAGRGKRGGARVIYYFHSNAMPVSALTTYAKNERADLSQADRNDFRRLTALLVERHARRAR